MRLLFSVIVLLILAGVVLEISAAKSSRDTEATKSNYKSGNAKEVRYSKSKLDSKKKGNGKKGEVVKEKIQHLSVERNEKIVSNGFSKKNQKKASEQVSREEQKRQKSNKQNKFDKTGENFKNHKNLRVNKDASRKYKRSIESEQPKESLSRGEDSQLNSASKKAVKNKFEKKSVSGVEKAFDGRLESDAIVSIEGESDDQQSKETISSLNNNIESSKKNKNAEERYTKSKKTRQQKHKHNGEESGEETMDLEKSEKSAEEKIKVLEELADSDTKTESLNTLPEEKTQGVNQKKPKCSKKESNTVSECESKVREESSKKYKSGGCNPEAETAAEEDRIQIEKSEHIAESKRYEADDEDSRNVEINSADEDETEGDESVEAEDCLRPDSVEEDITRESHSVE